jgi:hypothetical protein
VAAGIQKIEETGTVPGPLCFLAFRNNRWGRFTLADILRATGDAQESDYRCHYKTELLHDIPPAMTS